MATKTPHVRMYQPQTVTELPTSAYESLTHALQSGAEWWEGETVHGASLLVRLSTVTDVHFMTQQAIDAATETDTPWEPTT